MTDHLHRIDPYPAHLQRRAPGGDIIAHDYMAVIKNAINNHPRSLQTRIGPSEVAHPCSRRIGYKLAGTPEANHSDDTPWRPTVGTAVHMWNDDAFTQANTGHDDARWLTELRVCIGRIGGVDITGSLDLYDRATATIVDHKIVGPTSLKRYKSKQDPGAQYRGQIHSYGKGAIESRGLPVDRVMIAFLPSAGELRDAYLWSEAYDQAIADAALQRAEGIWQATQALGPAAMSLLPTADAFCTRCPWFNRQAPADASTSCPGHPAGGQEKRQDQILALI